MWKTSLSHQQKLNISDRFRLLLPPLKRLFPGSLTSFSASFPDFSGNYLNLDAGSHSQQKKARLLSPEVEPERGPLCLQFHYQLQGEAQGSLRVLLRDSDLDETLLWELRGDQGPHWREGRTILPQSPKEYQVRRLQPCSSRRASAHSVSLGSRWCLRVSLRTRPEATSG